jgi:hypothetical protein
MIQQHFNFVDKQMAIGFPVIIYQMNTRNYFHVCTPLWEQLSGNDPIEDWYGHRPSNPDPTLNTSCILYGKIKQRINAE